MPGPLATSSRMEALKSISIMESATTIVVAAGVVRWRIMVTPDVWAPSMANVLRPVRDWVLGIGRANTSAFGGVTNVAATAGPLHAYED